MRAVFSKFLIVGNCRNPLTIFVAFSGTLWYHINATYRYADANLKEVSAMKQNEITAAVFYAKKHLNNATVLEFAALLTPVHESGRIAYSFIAEENGERAIAETVTCDRDEAERIFNKLVCENVKPRELEAVVRSVSE